jgi:hypothetical protein
LSTKSAEYTILATPSDITKSNKYTVVVTVSAIEKDLEYSIWNADAPTITKSLKYAVLSPVAKTKSLKYTIQITPEALTLSVLYMTATAWKTISAVGWIYRSGQIHKPNYGGITLPYPDYADISPNLESAENTSLLGKTRISVFANKYNYTMRWNYLKLDYYEDLENVINNFDAAYFNYGKWPQSTDGILCLGRLSKRQLTYGAGDTFYLSDVTLNLTEVNTR